MRILLLILLLTGCYEPEPYEMWKDINQEQPEDGQEVWYYFDIFDRVYEGEYCHVREDGWDHMFFGDHGFLTDDVTYWMPRNKGDEMPEKPNELP